MVEYRIRNTLSVLVLLLVIFYTIKRLILGSQRQGHNNQTDIETKDLSGSSSSLLNLQLRGQALYCSCNLRL